MLKKQSKKSILCVCLFCVVVGLSCIVHAETYNVLESEKDEFINELYSNAIETDNGHYQVDKISEIESEDNFKEVSITKQLTGLTTKDETTVRSMFDEIIDYEDDEYQGILLLTDVAITGTETMAVEKIVSYDVPFSGYESNDLNNIEKTIVANGVTYYLINVDWTTEEARVIDGSEEVLTYSGTKHYETVVETTVPASYTATATYEGNVERIDKKYSLDVSYTFVEDQIEEAVIAVEDNNHSYIPEVIGIVISGIGVVVILFLLLSKNTKIYNLVDSKEVFVGMRRISKGKMTLDLSKIKSDNSNVYKIKFSKGLYNSIKNSELKIVKPNNSILTCNVASNNITIIL